MSEKTFDLARLPIGHSGRIDSLLARGLTRRRLLDLGLIPGSEITAIRCSPSGDPIAFLIRGTVIALREEVARQVIIQADPSSFKEDSNDSVKPGL